MHVEVVLATDEEFAEVANPVLVQMFGPDGVPCWRRSAVVCIPPVDQRQGAMSFAVLDERVPLAGAAGTYTVLVTMEHGGAPTGGTAQLRMFERDSDGPRRPLMVLGTAEQAARLASVPGLDVRRWPQAIDADVVVLVPAGATDEAIVAARQALSRGTGVVCLDPAGSYQRLVDRPDGASDFGGVSTMRSWLYQRDDWGRRHPMFDGLPSGGLLDWDHYRELFTPVVFRPPAEAAVTAVAGAIRASQDYDAGLTVWTEQVGPGLLLGVTFGLEPLAGRHPVADRLLYNAVAAVSGG